jgi:YfiH family protein
VIRSDKSGFILNSWPSLDRLGLKAGTVSGKNMAFHAPRGVNPEEIRENRRQLSRELDLDPEQWICADQVHSCSSVLVEMKDRGYGALTASSAIPLTDALILGEAKLQGMIFTADCLPLILYDREKQIAALVHAGWKGTAGGIAPLVLERMCSELGCRKEEILAVAGPAIQDCCYQIDRPVYEGLTRPYPETRGAFSPDGPDHWRLSLEKAVFYQLQACGLKEDQLEGSSLCSCCEKDLFSWRREGRESRRMATFICT